MLRPFLHLVCGGLALVAGVCGMASENPSTVFLSFAAGFLGVGWAGFGWAVRCLPDRRGFIGWMAGTWAVEIGFLALAGGPGLRDHTWIPVVNFMHHAMKDGPVFVLLSAWALLPFILCGLLGAILVAVWRRR